MSAELTYDTSAGNTFSEPDKAWLAANGIDPNRTSDAIDTSAGYNVTPTRGMTQDQLTAQFNQSQRAAEIKQLNTAFGQPAISPGNRNTPRIPNSAREGAQVAARAQKAADSKPPVQAAAISTERAATPSQSTERSGGPRR